MSRTPPASYHRDGRILVIHLDDQSVRQANDGIEQANGIARATNPSAQSAPRVTAIVNAYDIEARACHVVFIRPVDYRPQSASPTYNVAKFSEPKYAPGKATTIQLCTPAYYRDREELAPGIRDPQDGTLIRDGSVWASTMVGGTVRARLSFVSASEPWVFCAAHYRDGRELRRLRKTFNDEFGYSAATEITDPGSFAAWLGIDFALGLDKDIDVAISPIDELVYSGSQYKTGLWEGAAPIDTVVHVYHGPVCYEDRSAPVDTQEQWFDPHAGPRAWFTKGTQFSGQSEYRFAVSTPGSPVQPRQYIAVSPELRARTFVL